MLGIEHRIRYHPVSSLCIILTELSRLPLQLGMTIIQNTWMCSSMNIEHISVVTCE
jgi:hypothetical protein